MNLNLFTKLLALYGFIFCSEALYAQHVIRGHVVDSTKNQPLSNVHIVEQDVNKGTTTDSLGLFSIEVTSLESELMISHQGYKQKRIIASSTPLTIYLTEDNIHLNEMVFTALGIRKREETLGFSVQEVNGEDLISLESSNPMTSLRGKISGVFVSTASSSPGASSKVLIRGNTTFGNNEPLIIVDGIPIDNSTKNSYNDPYGGVNFSNRAIDISPNDIEKVTVLKGSAASALYGSRAGNGVIIYTTKKGRRNKAFEGQYSSEITFSKPVNLHDKQDKYGASSHDVNSSGASMSWGEELEEHQKVDGLDDFFRTGISQNHALSLSKGSKNAAFRALIGATDVQGIIPNSYWRRISTRINTDISLTDRWNLEGTFSLVNSGGNRSQKGSNFAGIMLSLYRAPIDFDPRAAYYDNPSTKGTNANYFTGYDNPYFSMDNNTLEDDVWRVMGSAKSTYDLVKNGENQIKTLQFIYKSSIDTYFETRKGQAPKGSNATSNRQGMIIDYNGSFSEWNNDFMLKGRADLDTDFGLDALLGANVRSQRDEHTISTGTNLSEDNYYNLANAQNVITNQNTILVNEYALYSDVNLSYKNIYHLGITGRNEWSSNFSSQNNSHLYGAANFNIIFSELINKTKTDNGILSFGKFRGSIGKTGVAPPPWRFGNYSSPVVFNDGYIDGNSTTPEGSLLINYDEIKGNPNLKPEIQIGSEIGFDTRFFNDKILLDVSLYKQRIKDILIPASVSSATGFQFEYQNIGEMENKGIEISFGYEGEIGKGIKWRSVLNYSRNKNEITDLQLTDGFDRLSLPDGGQATVKASAAEGQPFGVFYGPDWERHENGQLLVGEDGLYVQSEEVKAIGNPFPDFLLGWSNTFRYKRVSILMNFDGAFGLDIFNGTKAMMNFRGISEASEDREGPLVLEGVTENGEANTIEISKEDYWKYIEGIAASGSSMVERDIYYFKMRELGVSYDFKLKSESKIKALNLSVICTNLWMLTNYSSGDPETSLTGANSNLRGYDYFNYPNVRAFTFKASIHF